MIIPKIKLLSVVVPSRGRSRKLLRLLETLEGVAVDTQIPFEVVLVIDGDGGAPDFEASYPLRAFQIEHSGAGPARNKGIEASTGDAVLFLNDDVIPQPGFLDAHVRSLNLGHDAVLGASPWVEAETPSVFDGFIRHTPAIFDQAGLVDGQMYNYKYGWTLNLSIRRSVIDGMEVPFDEGIRPIYFEDIEFAYRCFGHADRIFYCEDALVVHDHRVTLREYFAREVLLGMMSVVLYERNADCYSDIFPHIPEDYAEMAESSVQMDSRDHIRILGRLRQMAGELLESADPVAQAGLFYDLHLPLKRRAFRIGLTAMTNNTHSWEKRVDFAVKLLENDCVFGSLAE